MKAKNPKTQLTIKEEINRERKFKRGELIEIVLKSMAVLTIVGGSIVFPNFPLVLGMIIKLIKDTEKIDIAPKKLNHTLKTLEKRKIIDLVYEGDNVYVKFRKDNQIDILKYSIKKLLDFKKQKHQWKRKWVLVVFDVPESERKKRAFLRDLLKQLGFYLYQQSVYVFPYECFEEIKLIKKVTDSGKYLKYIIAEKLEDEEKVKKFFHL